MQNQLPNKEAMNLKNRNRYMGGFGDSKREVEKVEIKL